MPYRTVTSGLIVDKTIATADIADDAVTAAKIAACTIEDANIKRGTITGAALHDDAVSLAKLGPGSPGCYIGFDGEGNPAELSGGGGGGDGCFECVCGTCCIKSPYGCFGATLIAPAWAGGSAEGSIATDGSGNLCYYSGGAWHQANAEDGGGCYECVCGTTCVASPFGCLDCVCACSCVVSDVGCFCDQLIAPSWAGDGAEGAIATDSSGNLCYYSGGAWHQVCVVS